MGLSGVSGPFRGAYNTFTFATANIGADYGGANGATKTKHLIWSYTIPAGMDIVIVDAQLYAGTAGAARINLEADGPSIIADTANSARGVALSSAVSVVATPSNSVFGTTTNLTPPAIGSKLVGGTVLTATTSGGGTAAVGVTGTILWYPITHPSRVRSAYE